MLSSLITALTKRKTKLVEEMFDFPPKTWDDFQKRLGRYEELTENIKEAEALMKGLEDDDKDLP